VTGHPNTIILGPFTADQDTAGDVRVVTALSGWTDAPPIRDNILGRPTQDGAFDGLPLYGPRVITVEGVVTTSSAAAAATAASTLAALTLRSRHDLTVINATTGTRTASGWVSSGATLTWIGDKTFTYTVQVTAPDPRKYGLATLGVLGVPTGIATDTGRVWTRVWPRSWGATTLSELGSLTLTNGGTATYWPALRIDGPVTNPALYSGSGDRLRIVRDVAAGQWVTVDCAARTVLLNGSVSLRSVTESAGSWLAVPPGGGSMSWTADAAGEGAGVTVQAYEGAWW
jgi:hypothetical protein